AAATQVISNLPQLSLGSLFKGRRETLQDLHRTLVRRAANKAVITANQTIAGLGGVGKTRLTLEYAWQYGSEYSARLYVKADSPASLRQNLAELAVKLEVPVSKSLEEQLQAVLEWLHTNTRWLLILDNVDSKDARTAVIQLLPQLTNGHVLITSRLSTWGKTTEQIRLDVLHEDAAVAFLLEATAEERRCMDTDAVDAAVLSRKLGHLPLALEHAAAFICKNATTVAYYLELWQRQDLEVLDWHTDLRDMYENSVLTTWAVTFAQLDNNGRGILRLLCWLAPDPIPLTLIEKQTSTSSEGSIQTRRGIANLVDYSFLKRSEDKQSVSMHRLVQEIAQYQLSAAEKAVWLQRSLQMLNDFCVGNPQDVNTWAPIYTPVRPHLSRILPTADNAGIAEPT
ncbi:MAG: AAA family ATPase, partial [Planctomycetaceae bacterium]